MLPAVVHVYRQPIFVIQSFVNLWWWWCWQYDTRWQCWAPPKMRCHQPITLVSPISRAVSSLPPNIHLCHITATVSTPLTSHPASSHSWIFSIVSAPSVHLKWSARLSTCWCKKWALSIPEMSSTPPQVWFNDIKKHHTQNFLLGWRPGSTFKLLVFNCICIWNIHNMGRTTCFDSGYQQTLDTWHCVSREQSVTLDNN